MLGVAAAAGIGLAANAISGDAIGLSAEPLAAGDDLAPPAARRGRPGEPGRRAPAPRGGGTRHERDVHVQRRRSGSSGGSGPSSGSSARARAATTSTDDPGDDSGGSSGSDDSGGKGRGRGRGGEDGPDDD